MSNINHSYIEKYLRSLITEEDHLLRELRDYAEINSIPIIHPEVKELLSLIIKISGTESILEIGTAIGYSSICFSKAMNGGRVLTVDIDKEMSELAKSNIKRANLCNNIEVVLGDASQLVLELSEKFDCIFLDGSKGHYIHLLEPCLKLLKTGGLLISDNVLFRGMVANKELVKRRKITIVKRMRKYLDVISKDNRLETTIIPIGDGLSISILK